MQKRMDEMERNVLESLKERKSEETQQNETLVEAVEKNVLRTMKEKESSTTKTLEKSIDGKLANLESKLCKEITENQKQIEVTPNKQGDKTKDLTKVVQNQYEKEK